MNVFIWFDLFANNQHLAVELDFNWWCGTFKSAIKQFGHTVMVLSPWIDPIPLTRAWCLFEIYCSVITNSKFEVAMSKNEQESFFIAMSDKENNAIKQAKIKRYFFIKKEQRNLRYSIF